MPKFNDTAYYSELDEARRLAQVGAIADPNEALSENQTKWAYWQTLVSYGAFAATSKSIVASGDVDLEDGDYMFVEIDPNGADRNVIMPAKGGDNHVYVLRNAGSANILTVKTDGGTEITTINAGDVALIVPSAAHDFAAITGASAPGTGVDLSEVYAMVG